MRFMKVIHRRMAPRKSRVRPEFRARDAKRTIVVNDPADPNRLVLRSNGVLLRFRTRLTSVTLDRELASGAVPESRTVLAARANYLISSSARRAIARDWRNLLDTATRAPQHGNGRLVHICWDRILDSEIWIETMMTSLSDGSPSAVRGVAMASWLLSDGSGPIYNRGSDTDLRSAVREVTSLLDPVAARI